MISPEENNFIKNTESSDHSELQSFIESSLDEHAGSLIEEAELSLNDADLARSAVHATFLELCKQEPEGIPDDLGVWLSNLCARHCEKLKMKNKPSRSGDEIRWKKVASAETKRHKDTDSKTLLPSQYASIRRASASPNKYSNLLKFSPKTNPRKAGLLVLSVALLILAIAFLAYSIFSSKDATTEKSPEESRRISTDRDQIKVAKGKIGQPLSLPLSHVDGNLSEIKKTIQNGELPAKDDVRIEEVVNSFPIGIKGTAALWKGCSVSAEILSSPWKPSASLVLVHVRGAKSDSVKVAVEYRPQSGSVLSQRVLGYQESDTQETNGETEMAEGSDILLILEIEANSYELGELAWTVNGDEAPALPLHRNPAKEPSDDARFSALACSFGFWLREEKRDMVDEPLLLALARECAADDMEPGRFDFLLLIDQAVKLRQQE